MRAKWVSPVPAQGGGVKLGGGGAAPRVLNVARKGSGKDVTVAMKDVKSPQAQNLIDSVTRDALADSLGGSPHQGALAVFQKGARADPNEKTRNLFVERDLLADS